MNQSLSRLKLFAAWILVAALSLTVTSCGAARKPAAKKHSGCNCGF